MNTTILLGGAHRGGTAITKVALKYLPDVRQFKEVTVVDPKEDRAVKLAEEWSRNGVHAEGIKESCEEVVNRTEADAVILSIDDIKPMSSVLKKSPLPAQWQLMIKGTGFNGPLAGLSGTVGAGDTDGRKASIRLIEELGSFIQPQSSVNIRSNFLNADGLPLLREAVSEHSVMRLGMLERDPDDIPGGALNFFWGGANYPMVVQEKPSHRWRETKQQAIETNLPADLKNNPAFAVASIGNGTVDFLLVATTRGRRLIRFHMPLIHMLPDYGFGHVIGGLLSGAVAAAVVTD
ncbi:MAG: hypothetical protein M0022_03400 [Desulfobacteraceae bacterium]|nr:hypothetical protein [Desulfobacteraceae bacterium]